MAEQICEQVYMSMGPTNHEFIDKLLNWVDKFLLLLEWCVSVLTSIMCKGVAVKDYILNCNSVVNVLRNNRPSAVDFDSVLHALATCAR